MVISLKQDPKLLYMPNLDEVFRDVVNECYLDQSVRITMS